MTSAIGLPATTSYPLPPPASNATPLILKNSHLLPIISTRHVYFRARMVTRAAVSVLNEASPSTASEQEINEELAASKKVGSRVRVRVPLKLYHVPKVPEVDITGKEGVVKQYVGIWKGKRISANLPFKVEFETEVEGRGKVKFFAHLRDDEFELVD